jgi:hypothetical protein
MWQLIILAFVHLFLKDHVNGKAKFHKHAKDATLPTKEKEQIIDWVLHM